MAKRTTGFDLSRRFNNGPVGVVVVKRMNFLLSWEKSAAAEQGIKESKMQKCCV
jgi:hypothetical protein